MKKFLAFMFLSGTALAQMSGSQVAPRPSAPPPAPVVKSQPPTSPPRPQTQSAASTERAIGEAYTLIATEAFNTPTPANKLTMILGISKLNGLSHPIDFKKAPPKAHPAIPYLSFDPMASLTRNEAQYRTGDSGRAAYSTRRVAQICAECHVNLKKPVWTSVGPTQSLSQFEWAEIYKFAGRYDQALLSYEKVFNVPGLATSQPAVWEKTALNIVALGVEASSNAYTYVDMISAAMPTAQISGPQRNLLNGWRTIGKQWGAERTSVTKPNDMLVQARQFMTIGEQMNRQANHSGWIHYVRAMLVLKKVMISGSVEQKARAFFMAGELREKIPLDGYWLHSEDYYEACIRVAPKGADAPKCLQALEGLSRRITRYGLDSDGMKSLPK